MDAVNLQDKLSRGMGIAARKLGMPTTVYRPVDFAQPLKQQHRRMEISATFEPVGRPNDTRGIVSSVWLGIFDSLYTRQGDYLVNAQNTYFIGSQTPTFSIQCIVTNRVLSLSRATFTAQGGYSGISDADSQVILSEWPVNLTELGPGPSSQGVTSQAFGTRAALLPVLPVTPRAGDVATDDLGSTYVVDAAEQNVLGWRLLVRQIGA